MATNLDCPHDIKQYATSDKNNYNSSDDYLVEWIQDGKSFQVRHNVNYGKFAMTVEREGNDLEYLALLGKWPHHWSADEQLQLAMEYLKRGGAKGERLFLVLIPSSVPDNQGATEFHIGIKRVVEVSSDMEVNIENYVRTKLTMQRKAGKYARDLAILSRDIKNELQKIEASD